MIHGRPNHPTNRPPTLSSLIMRLEGVAKAREDAPGRVNDAWAADQLEQIAELLFRVAHFYKHGERG